MAVRTGPMLVSLRFLQKKIPALASVNRSTYKMVAKIRAVVMQAKAHYCIGLIAVTTITQEVTFINY